MRMPLLAMILSLPALAVLPRTAPAEERTVKELAPSRRDLLRAACFEVVVPKPKQDTLTYERDLNHASVPFHVRTDPYYSIGTAFAVSDHELVTAFHVLSLHESPLAPPKIFIRDQDQKVFEVDQILASDQHRDVVRFGVKGRTFSRWLPLREGADMDRTVFSAGNAYGEGIVIRRGELLGTHPEEESGAFNLLKSSADVNSGNSGGPLLDPEGRVIGVVLSRKDNLCYSLPVSELKQVGKERARFHTQMSFGFGLFPKRTPLLTYEHHLPLPMAYMDLRAREAEHRKVYYQQEMDRIFQPGFDELFPEGASSRDVILDIPTATTPQVLFKEKDSQKWALSGIDYKTTDLGQGGQLQHAEAGGHIWFHLKRPRQGADLALETSPKAFMDLLLKGVSIPRNYGGEQVRITSFGEPKEQAVDTDRWGRIWRRHSWFLEATDQVATTYTTSTPRGLVGFLHFASSASHHEWCYDLRRTLDFTYVPYQGELRDWSAFLARPAHLPQPFRNLSVQLEPGQRLSLRTPGLEAQLPAGPITLGPESTLGMYMGWAPEGGGVRWSLRRLVLQAEDDDNYAVLLHHLNPGPEADEAQRKGWRDLVRARHPYTRKAFADKGTTDIAGLLPGGEQDSGRWTLYLSRVGTEPEARMAEWLERLLAGIKPTR